jgi:hypothetical protein
VVDTTEQIQGYIVTINTLGLPVEMYLSAVMSCALELVCCILLCSVLLDLLTGLPFNSFITRKWRAA